MTKILLNWKRRLQAELIDLGDSRSVDDLLFKLREWDLDTIRYSTRNSFFDDAVDRLKVHQGWNSPDEVIRASIFTFLAKLPSHNLNKIPVTDRDVLRALIGTKAERLVFLYRTADRRRLLDTVQELVRSGSRPIIPHLSIPTWRTSGDGGALSMTPDELARLLELHLVELITSRGWDDGFPPISLVEISGLIKSMTWSGGDTDRFAAFLPPPASTEEEMEFLEEYRCVGFSGRAHEPSQFFRRFEKCLGELMLSHALCDLVQGDYDACLASVREAKLLFEARACPWDQRLRLEEWIFIATQLDKYARVGGLAVSRMENNKSPVHLYRTLLEDNMSELHPELHKVLSHDDFNGGSERSTAPSASYTAEALRLPAEYSSIASAFEGVRPKLIEELDILDRFGFESSTGPDSTSRQTGLYPLFQAGVKHYANCTASPTSVRLIEIFDLASLSGDAFVWRMGPWTRYEQGPREDPLGLRVQIALLPPQGDFGLRVRANNFLIGQSSVLIFDESSGFEAWNHSAEELVFLVVYMWPPSLREDQIMHMKTTQNRIIAIAERIADMKTTLSTRNQRSAIQR